LIADPFHNGLVVVFWMAIGMTVLGALASLIRAQNTPAELAESQPPLPAARVPEPLDEPATRD
jgi:hypothetical protein